MRPTLVLLVLMACCKVANAMTAGELAEKGDADRRIKLTRTSQQGDDIAASIFLGYVTATIDMAREAGGVCKQKHDVTGEQIFATVEVYLDQHPERWHEPAAKVVLDALQTVVPCQGK
jgi:hypothetical protein